MLHSSPPQLPNPHLNAPIRKSQLPKGKKTQGEGIVSQSWQAIKKIIQDVSQAAQYSFARLTNSSQSSKQPLVCKKPSQMTIELIRSIHRGFDPLELSYSRWSFQEEEQKRQEKELVEQLVRKQTLLTEPAKKKHKKIVRIGQVDFQQPQFSYQRCRIQNVAAMQKRVQNYLQRAHQQPQNTHPNQPHPNQQQSLNPQPNSHHLVAQNQQPNLVSHSNSSPPTLEKNKVEATQTPNQSPSQQPPQSIQSQSQQLPQAKQPAQSKQQSAHQKALQAQPLQLNQSGQPNQSQSVSSQSTAALQPNAQEVVLPTPVAEISKVQKVAALANLTQNPFLKAPKKTLSFNDLFASQTNNLFNNNASTANPIQNKEKQETTGFLTESNKHFLSSNQNLQKQQQTNKNRPKADMFSSKPSNQHTNLPKNEVKQLQNPAFTSLNNNLANPFSQQKTFEIAKKGLAANQMTTSPIFTQNSGFSQLNPHLSQQRAQQEGPRLSVLTGLAPRTPASNLEAKDLFSIKQNPTYQSLFNTDARQATEKKPYRSNRRQHKKQTRIS